MPSVQIALRVPPDVIERADALVPALPAAAHASGDVSRSDVLRTALQLGLAQLEQQHASKQKRRR